MCFAKKKLYMYVMKISISIKIKCIAHTVGRLLEGLVLELFAR